MSVLSGTPTGGVVYPFLLRGLADWEALLGLRAGELPAASGPWTKTYRQTEHNVPSPGGCFSILVRKNSPGLQFEQPSTQPSSSEGSRLGIFHWTALAECAVREQGVVLGCFTNRAHWEGFTRGWVAPFLSALGFIIGQERWGQPERGEIWLFPSRAIQWPAPSEALAQLLQTLVQLHGGPKLLVDVSHAKKTRPADPTELTINCKVAPAQALPADAPQLTELVRALDRAQREAPRGFVGLKHFRDRILAPNATAEARQSQLDAALEAGIVAVRQVTDPKSESLTAALELNHSNAIVRSTLGATSPQR